jgi:hypothetical protein
MGRISKKRESDQLKKPGADLQKATKSPSNQL